MKSIIRLFVAVVSIIVITICAALIWRKVFPAEIDVTEHSIYTLSGSTKNVIDKLNHPVTLKLYYARKAAMKVGSDQLRYWNQYYLYVRDLLQKYDEVGGAKVDLEVIDPRTFSRKEEEATEYGIRQFPITDDENFYFGLAVVSEMGKVETIEFFSPERQDFIEYDITKLVSAMMESEKQKVGLISSLPVLGPGDMSPYQMQMMRAQGQQMPRPWSIVSHLEQLNYELEKVAVKDAAISGDIDFLMVVHPKGLDEETLFAIDQYVMKGGKLIVFVDPFCRADQPQAMGRNQMQAMMTHEASSDLSLLENWGVELAKSEGTYEIAADISLARKRMMQGQLPARFLPDMVLGGPECLNEDEVMVQGFNSIRVSMAGYLREVPGFAEGAAVDIRPLIHTTRDHSMIWIPEGVFEMRMPQPKKILQEAKEVGDSLTLACLITGAIETGYPDGIDIDAVADKEMNDDKDEDGDEKENDEKDEDKDKDDKKHLEPVKKAAEGATVLVVSDVDMITDTMAYTNVFGMVSPSGDNAPFLVNALDFLAGSNELIALRSRGRAQRPFELFEEIEREEEQKIADEDQKLQAKIDEYNKEISDLAKKGGDGDVLVDQVMKRRRELQSKLLDARRKQRDLKSGSRARIESLQWNSKVFNMLGAPVILLLIAISIWIYRYNRRCSQLQKR